MRVLVLGGYGNFGARISRALSSEPGISLLIGGRDAQRAAALARELGQAAQGLQVDIAAPGLAELLRAQRVELLIHMAGPFQGLDYTVARAAAAAGAHYIDLADGRRFVCDFAAALDADFRAAGRLAISGASTVPALSSAVVDTLCPGWRQIAQIDICIAPAQTAPRGEATLAGVLSYCGKAIEVWQDGRWQTRHGWASPTRVHFQRLRPRLGALCDIPDLELFPAHYPGLRTLQFRAALELGLAQRGLALLATLRRAGLLRRPQDLAPLLNRSASLLDRFGSALGGMVVRVEGLDATGAPARRAWHIAADDDHGPEIPCMAAILLARRLARGDASLPSGARACTDARTRQKYMVLSANVTGKAQTELAVVERGKLSFSATILCIPTSENTWM